MAVGPGRGDRIAADHRDVHEPGLLVGQDRTAVEPAGHPGLAATERARAEPAERGRVVGRGVTVVPDDLEPAGAAIRVDGDWADRHVTDRTPLLADGCRPPRSSPGTGAAAPRWCRPSPVSELGRLKPGYPPAGEPRDRPRHQAIRHDRRPRWPRVRGRARRGLRLPRRERRRQDDHDADLPRDRRGRRADRSAGRVGRPRSWPAGRGATCPRNAGSTRG